jgi:two-component system, NtrC family, nitrogen regulation response regulator NtrX
MSVNQILVVDDEVGIRELLFEILRDEGYGVRLAENASSARSARKEMRPDLVLLDIWMPDTDGITLLKEWAGTGLLTMPVVMMSGHGTIDSAVEATRIGAFDFLEKPISLPKLLATVSKALAGGKVQPKTGLTVAHLGRARAVQELRQRLEQVSRLKTPLLLTGEAGSGFEICARYLHLPNTPWTAPEHSDWLATNPFEPLADTRDGLLFLHEIGTLNRAEQKGLMQLLAKLDKFNVRLVAAASEPLATLVEEGNFEAALYNQLSGLTLRLPPLSEHPEDIPEIATAQLTQLVDANEVPLRTLTVGALNLMRNLDWPGNLPVLQNVVKTLALTSLSGDINGEDVNRVAKEFNLAPREQSIVEVGISLDMPLREAREQFEKQYFQHHIRREEGNMSRVADRVGLERTHLYRKLKQLGIRPSGKAEEGIGGA